MGVVPRAGDLERRAAMRAELTERYHRIGRATHEQHRAARACGERRKGRARDMRRARIGRQSEAAFDGGDAALELLAKMRAGLRASSAIAAKSASVQSILGPIPSTEATLTPNQPLASARPTYAPSECPMSR